jgi:hypothetical protein
MKDIPPLMKKIKHTIKNHKYKSESTSREFDA